MNSTSMWQNVGEALMFLAEVKDPRSRGALAIVHHGCLECDGALPPHFTDGTLRPAGPVDLLTLYTVVARTFADWRSDWSSTVDNTNEVIDARQIEEVLDSLDSDRLRAILKLFIINLEQVVTVREMHFDLVFCCKLLATCFGDAKRLDDVLSGLVGREHERIANDNESLFGWVDDRVTR